jgi:hypothetical protein
MVRSVTLMLLSALAFTGCFILPDAKSPATGAVATGDPLNVVDDLKVWTTTSKEKVGETVYTDENGKEIGKGTSYADKTTVHTAQVWYLVQGPAKIDDEDFFRIAGDNDSLTRTQEMRAEAKKWNTRGKYTMIGGAVGVIAGIFVPQPLIRTILLAGGGLAVSGGWYMSYWGAQQMEPEVHAVDRSIADRAAKNYDQNLGHAAGVSMTKSF